MEKENINRKNIALLLKIGIIGAFIILAGDMVIGWGIKDMSIPGIEGQISQYLNVSDKRMFWASLFGFTGVPIAVVGHIGIYKLLKPYSCKYANMYAIGILGFLAFGGAGVHVSCVEAAFFYKYISRASCEEALGLVIKFGLYFLLPLYIILLTGWFIMVYAHIRAVLKGLSPYPRWFWVFSMPVGSLIFSLTGLLGNYALVNAIMVGAFSLGNIWSLAGHLLMLKRAKGAEN